MAEQNEKKKYIMCSKCRCLYINDDEHIKNDFGFTRLEERYKTCVKCRAYKLDNRERILKQGRERAKDYYEENKEAELERTKQYRDHNKDKIKEKSAEVIECKMCGSMVRNWGMACHMRTNKCNNKSNKT